jgi:hypothetical protein
MTAKFIILAGLLVVAVGLVWLLAERFGLGRLPGDIVIEREGLTLYIPIHDLNNCERCTDLFWLIGR